ncbi:DUF1176 domain-containing protein [Cohaesibacter gelatinilyticus]|uniref:DUF1176 domain-containing protein n=1 Tax=Cohaesibacter gelatinilyticus TaxID=372072 RepID=A0A285PP01_9HYPH|nr:DUF1176 domain-containing protein [Cohaesibacter gelatinilyticus]SNZ21651.1 Protein of unknown function [Cohaesibacter gelatinilyticus]
MTKSFLFSLRPIAKTFRLASRQLALLASVGIASFIGIANTNAGGFREFKDSRTWCTIALSCSVSTSAKAYNGITTLSIRRHNPLSAPLELVLEAKDAFSAGDQIDFLIDDKELLHIELQPDDPAIGSTNYVVSQQSVVDSAIEDLKKGSQALIVLRKNGEQIDSQFSLAGTVASMLFLDEFQDLLDTPYAFHAIGTKKPNPRLNIESITRLDQVPRSILTNWFVGEEKECSFFSDTKMERLTFGDGFKMQIGTKGKSDGGTLYSLPCGTGGAYNQPYSLFFEPNDTTKLISQIPFRVNGKAQAKQEMPDAWNISWDFKNKNLESFFKGRGLGDCGSYSRWSLMNQNGTYFFNLKEMRVKDDCDGDYAGGPTKWPKVN